MFGARLGQLPGPRQGPPLLWGQGSRKAGGLASLEEAGSADKTQDTQVNLNLRHAENDFMSQAVFGMDSH